MIAVERIDDSFERWQELLDLIMSSFSYMDGVIDPPSSAYRLTLSNLKEKAQTEIAYLAMDEGVLLGCMFCKPEEEAATLYIGKLAVSPSSQGKGVGFLLLQKAEEVARSKSLVAVRLETRIELIRNHKRFGAWGFVKTAEKAHPGYDRVTYIEMTKRLA